MVVDDHPMWRDGVARDLTDAGYLVTAAVGDGAQALRVAPAARPDVVVLDLQLPDLSGVEVIRGVLDALPAVRILKLSASGEQRDVLDALKAAATGYLVKSAGPGARAWILLEDEGEGVRVTIRDDGVGFEPNRLEDAARSGRLGVAQSMRGRINDLGGTTAIHSRPGKGTEVEIWIPRQH